MRTLLPIPASIAAIITLIGGLFVSGLLASWIKNEGHRTEARVLERGADAYQSAIQNGVIDVVDTLDTVNQLFVMANSIDAAQYRVFAQPLLRRHPHVDAFVFQYATAAQAGTDVRHSPLPDFIETRRQGGNMFHAQSAEAVYLGQAAAAAAAAARPAASDMFALPQGSGMPPAFVLVAPAYRRDRLYGHAAAVIRAGDMIAQALGRANLLNSADFAIRVRAGPGPDASHPVFRNGDDSADAAAASLLPDWLGYRVMTVSRAFDAAGMQWHIDVSTRPDFFGSVHANAWIVLAGGCLASLLAAIYLYSLGGYARRLARANTLLAEDIAARERIERALRLSEERYRRLARLSSDWRWEQNTQLRFTQISGDKSVGFTVEQILGKTLGDLGIEADPADWALHKALVRACQPFPDIELKLTGANGDIHWIVASGEPMFGDDGRFAGYRGTAKDLTARKQTELALRRSQQELLELSAYQERVKEDERKRIAREIHDDLGQNLLVLRIDVSMLDAATAGKLPEINEKVRSLLAQIDITMKSVRAIINHLRPAALDVGLRAAIEWQVQQFKSRSSIPCSLSFGQSDFDALLGEESATSIFRIVQESLTNISRHAQATRAEIAVWRAGNMLTITIGDDGVGTFPGDQRKPRSFGLIGIRERVRQMGGEFAVESRPGQGTLLTVTIPLNAGYAAAA